MEQEFLMNMNSTVTDSSIWSSA